MINNHETDDNDVESDDECNDADEDDEHKNDGNG